MNFEEWTELDEAERHLVANPKPGLGGGYGFEVKWIAYSIARNRVLDVIVPHLRELVDAVRPKCGRCNGWGKVHVWDDLPRAASAKSAEQPCPDCDGTGWAK